MARGLQMTMTTLRVLMVLLENPAAKRYGLDISKATGLGVGTVYPILMRFEQAGWLTSAWEEIDPQVAGRPRRRFYRLTAEGVRSARVALVEAQQALEPTRQGGNGLLNPREVPGWNYSSA